MQAAKLLSPDLAVNPYKWVFIPFLVVLYD